MFSILAANKIFHVTVLLLVYFCDQFVAPEIHHTADVAAVFVNNQHGTIYSNKDKMLMKTHKYTQHTVTRVEKLKLMHLKAIYLDFLPYMLNICRNLNF